MERSAKVLQNFHDKESEWVKNFKTAAIVRFCDADNVIGYSVIVENNH